ncbi:MAG: hypothetical protein ACI82F_001772 [Planctomycetota bacterium]|jgi:hypothetical protein
MKHRREITTFSLSFLDVMCCGFGAVVLLVMILNGQTLERRDEKVQESKDELEEEQILTEAAKKHLADLKQKVSKAERDALKVQEEAGGLSQEIEAEAEKGTDQAAQEKKNEEELKALQAQLDELAEKRADEAEKVVPDVAQGESRVGFDGDGKRQYLTGLKLGGERTLILIDASASMLDPMIVNAIVKSLESEEVRRKSAKWQRVVSSVHWLVANLPADRHFQIYSFNTEATPLLSGSAGQWLSTSSKDHSTRAIAAARELAPIGGTNLLRAFEVIRQLNPLPDSVLLLTDGLPTQGSNPNVPAKVSSAQRLQLFSEAIRVLRKDVPINTLLYPIEGDPRAASAFWELALMTRGSLITPTEDWP